MENLRDKSKLMISHMSLLKHLYLFFFFKARIGTHFQNNHLIIFLSYTNMVVWTDTFDVRV